MSEAEGLMFFGGMAIVISLICLAGIVYCTRSMRRIEMELFILRNGEDQRESLPNVYSGVSMPDVKPPKTAGKRVTTLDIDTQHWDLSNIQSMVVMRDTEQVEYCRSNGITIEHEPKIGSPYVFAKESEHPFLFNGSADQGKG